MGIQHSIHQLRPAFLIALLIFLSGCAELKNDMNALSSATLNKPLVETDLAKMAQQQAALVDTTNDCSCMVCKQKTPWLSSVPSLYEGECSFDTNCSRDEIHNISITTTSTHTFVQRALVGQGPSMGTFRYANKFCNNSLSLATQWVTRQQFSYPIVSKSIPKCYLEKNVMPLYLLYSTGTSPDPNEGGKFAAQFKDLGPVLIVSDFSAKKDASRDDTSIIRAQLQAMKQECPNCLIGFGVKYGETEFAHSVLSDKATRDAVDFIGVGFDNKEMMKKESTCDPNVAITKLFVWSRNLTYAFDKPVVWAYILLDKGIFVMGNGKQCRWTEDYNTQFIKIYYLQLQQLTSSGIIGSSMYSLVSNAGGGPIDCANCGMFDFSKQNADQLQEFRHWFYFCQIAYSGPYAPIIHFPVGPLPQCVLVSSNYQIPFATISIDNPLDPLKSDPLEYTCTGCLYYEDLPDPYDRCITPYSPGSAPGASDPSDNDLCNTYKDVSDGYSDLYSIPPAITRAVMWVMSGGAGTIDKCAYYYATSSDPFCNPGPAPPPYPPYISDPSSVCSISPQPQSGQRYCNFGLTGLQIAPFTYYNSDPHGLELPYNAKRCNPNFNPFDPYDNLCAFGGELSKNLSSAYKFVDENADKLLQFRGTDYESDERDLIAMFIALHMYYGDWDSSWISSYASITPNPSDASCTYTDFIDYTTKRNKQMYGYDFAYEVIRKYRYIISQCYSDFNCPA
ncbi:MAG: hypothetical protein QW035_04055 [Candidatus Anstonellales archaeon]